MSFCRPMLLCCVLSFSVVSAEEPCEFEEQIEITTQDIFDLNAPETVWFHKLANMLNVVTKEETIANEIAFVSNKCTLNDRDLAEVERHLRKLKYINEATAARQKDGTISINTTDKWTLMPTVDYGRKGGNNKFSIGIKDRNLFGYGIDAEVEYFKDVQRSGYVLDLHFPLFTQNNIRGSLTFSDTDDGSTQGISLTKLFVSFDTDNAFGLSVYKGDQSQQYFLNGRDFYSLSFSDQRANAHWGTLLSREAKSVLRYTIGVDYEKRTFNAFEYNINDGIPPRPLNREYLIPFITLEYLEDDFKELSNVHLINQIEDFNLGWHIETQIGINVVSRENNESLFVTEVEASKGTQINEDTLVLTDLKVKSFIGDTELSRYLISVNNELFYTLSPKVGIYSAQHLKISQNQFVDQPIVIGEENGVRGYPLEFQRGNSTIALTGEVRYYPNINIYRFFELGAAAFVDVGKAFGTEDFGSQPTKWLPSVGIGARLYSRQASESKVIHLDLSFPMLNHENVNNVEFLVTAKSSF